MRAVRGQQTVPRSALSLWAIRLAIFAAALLAAAGALHRLFGLSTPVALNLFIVSFGLAALAILLAVFGMIAIWWSGARGAGRAGAAVLIAGAILAWPLAYLPAAMATPPLNDITTDFENPPAFKAVSERRPPGALATTYDAGRNAPLQKELYPDIQPIIVNRPASEAFEITLQAVRRLRYEVVAEEEPGTQQIGRIEAAARTVIIGFRDDIAIRIVGRADRSRIDVRSASRWGEHDFGSNAARVRRVIRAILSGLQANVPGTRE
jgi:uncharacterized protein (DUF1499 family)